MKLTRYKKWAALMLALANGWFAAAQSNGVPGPTAYSAFSGFISERNIFDPNRYPRNSQNYVRNYRQTRVVRSAPTFTLKGTLSYGKGMFAIFDGNNSDLRKVLYQSNSNGIAGYLVTEITFDGVKLQTADKKQTVELKIGDSMRQEGSTWQLAGKGESSAGNSVGESPAPAAADNSSPDTGAAPSPALEGNDILKKLMQQREQQLK